MFKLYGNEDFLLIDNFSFFKFWEARLSQRVGKFQVIKEELESWD